MTRPITTTAALLALAAAAAACDSSTDPDPPSADDIQLTADVDLLPAGQTRQLQTVALDAAGNIVRGADIEYTSSSTAIATVDDEGFVTGEGDGVATITASTDGASDNAQIGIYAIGDLCQNALLLDLGQSVRSSLQSGDCDELIDDGSFVDVWAFDLDEETDVTIRMTSNDFDAFLWLIDEDDDQLVDDNSAGGTNAEILARLPAGSYLIFANHFPGAQGAYTLYLAGSTTAASSTTAIRSLETTAVDPAEVLDSPRQVRTTPRVRPHQP